MDILCTKIKWTPKVQTFRAQKIKWTPKVQTFRAQKIKWTSKSEDISCTKKANSQRYRTNPSISIQIDEK